MATYSYNAVDAKGANLEGTLDAADRMTVVKALSRQGLRPISIKEVSSLATGSKQSFFSGNKVKTDHLVIFTRELSAMVSAGVPLLRALNSLHDHSESATLKKIIANVIKDIEGGATLASSLRKYPNTFNDVYVNMVQAGESAGILDDILKRVAIQQEKNASIRKRVKSAMTYPMVLVGIMVIAFFGLMLFVVPQIGKIIKDLGGPDAELPMLTQIMLGCSHILTTYWYIIMPLFAGSIYGLIRYTRTPTGRLKLHQLMLKIPGISTIVTKVVIARFSRTFSSLIGAGVPVLEAIDVTAGAVGNLVYQDALLKAAEKVKNGATLSSVIENNPLFPAIVSQMLSVGEETGQTDTVLLKVADFYEEEVDVAIEGLSSIIEPVMIVLMGGAVGLIAASVMLPIAGLSKSIKG